jgi:hypothetical protein
MRHLNEEDLIDLAEGARPEGSVPHLASCESCRRQLADLRAVMSAAADVEVPEPSPLFWQHLSARVHEAVSNEERGSASAWRPPWLGWRVVVPAVAVAAVALAAAITLRTEVPRPFVAPHGLKPHSAAVAETPPGADDVVSLADDASLSLIAELARGLDWDAAVEAGLATQAGAVDRVVLELTANERLELQRILKAELPQPGA